MYINNLLGNALVIAAALGHTWPDSKLVRALEDAPDEARDIEALIRAAAEDMDVEGWPSPTSYNRSQDVLWHVTGGGSVLLAWSEEARFAAHMGPGGRVRWAAWSSQECCEKASWAYPGYDPRPLRYDNNYFYQRLGNARENRTRATGSLLGTLDRHIAGDAGLPKWLDPNYAKAAATTLGVDDPAEVFGETTMPTHLVGLWWHREVAALWAAGADLDWLAHRLLSYNRMDRELANRFFKPTDEASETTQRALARVSALEQLAHEEARRQALAFSLIEEDEEETDVSH